MCFCVRQMAFLVCLSYVRGFNWCFSHCDNVRMYLKKIHCTLVQQNHGEKIKMKKRRVVVSESSGTKRVRKNQSENADLIFKRLVTDAGYSEKDADKIWKFYHH